MSKDQADALWWAGFWTAAKTVGIGLLIVGIFVGYACAKVLPGPDGSFYEAALDLAENVSPEARPYTRYFSLYGCPEEERDRLTAAVSYWINSLSYNKILVKPVPVAEGTLLRIDLRDLGWDRFSRAERLSRFKSRGVKFREGSVSPDAWEALVARDQYFEVSQEYGGEYHRGWIKPDREEAARKLSRSSLFIVRAETFLVETGFDRNDAEGRTDGLYSDFLCLPETEEDLYKALGVNEGLVGTESLVSGGAVIQSGVARHNRVLELLPTLFGGTQRYLWRTYDVRSNVKDESVLDTFLGKDGFHGLDRAGGELIFDLPNGLQGYYLVNADGKQVGEVPTDIAQRKAHPVDVVVYNGWTCTACHSSGINSFSDVISTMATAPGVGLSTVVKDDGKYSRAEADREARRLENYFLSRLQDAIKGHQAAFESAVKACTGLTGAENAAAFVGAIESHFYGYIDLTTAAREMGLDRDAARVALARCGDAGAFAIVTNQPIARDRWERDTFAAAMRVRKFDWEEGHP